MANFTHFDLEPLSRGESALFGAADAPMSPRAALATWFAASLGGWALVLFGLAVIS
ncbi:MAG: hypothetical protein WCF16_08200 [Alphaproteobacteria bacterium]